MNLVIRRTVMMFLIVIAIALIIALNLYIKWNEKFEQIFCLSVILAALLYGFCIAYLFWIVTRVAHKPYKTVYQILIKQSLIFNFFIFKLVPLSFNFLLYGRLKLWYIFYGQPLNIAVNFRLHNQWNISWLNLINFKYFIIFIITFDVTFKVMINYIFNLKV